MRSNRSISNFCVSGFCCKEMIENQYSHLEFASLFQNVRLESQNSGWPLVFMGDPFPPLRILNPPILRSTRGGIKDLWIQLALLKEFQGTSEGLSEASEKHFHIFVKLEVPFRRFWEDFWGAEAAHDLLMPQYTFQT